MIAVRRALSSLQVLSPDEQLAAAESRLGGKPGGVLGGFMAGSEIDPAAHRIDGRLLEAIVARALGGARGAVFTDTAEARILAALGLARVAVRRGVCAEEATRVLVGTARPTRRVTDALDGVRVFDPCCGGGALLIAALGVARRCGFTLHLLGGDVAPLAVRAASARLALLGAPATVVCVDAFARAWPEADLVLTNPPFVRHEALPPAEKRRVAAASGLSRQADLSAHVAMMALRHAPDVALVWPRALDTSRSAEPLLALSRERGGFTLRLRSRSAGSFAASVDTILAVWSRDHRGGADVEVAVPLARLRPAQIVSLVERRGGSRRAPGSGGFDIAGRGTVRLGDVCDVRFGMKSGCNGFFHLRPVGCGRFESALAGEVELAPDDSQRLLCSLKEAAAPELARPARHLFRPVHASAAAAAYIAAGEALGVSRRPTCAGRSPWWIVAPGRSPAPVLYPAKIGARAFAVLNEQGWWEDKKWHALFPHPPLEPWMVAVVLGATPIRLAVDRAARQLTGMQAIADVDCRVLAAAPFPLPRKLRAASAALHACRDALARDPVTTDVRTMLARPAQEELDTIIGRALGLSRSAVAASRREMIGRVASRLEHAAAVRAAIARVAS